MEWSVKRWSGRSNDLPKVIFLGDEQQARTKYNKIQKSLRQGSVYLIDPNGKIIENTFAPRLRTKW